MNDIMNAITNAETAILGRRPGSIIAPPDQQNDSERNRQVTRPPTKDERISALQTENGILKAGIVTLGDELLLATHTTLGRMLIEVGIAANDLRESIPLSNQVQEEGELQEEQQATQRCKFRLDKMIRKISEAHEKADQDLQDVARKLDMLKDRVDGSKISAKPATGAKRSWSSQALEYGMVDENNTTKRTKIAEKENMQRIIPNIAGESGQPPRPVLQVPSPSHLNIPISDAGRARSDTPIHPDRQMLMQQTEIKIEDVEKYGPISVPRLVRARKGWKLHYDTKRIDAEEAEWLMKAKQSWTQGGWTDKGAWLKAVMVEYQHCKAQCQTRAELEDALQGLILRCQTRRFEPPGLRGGSRKDLAEHDTVHLLF